MNCVRTLEEAGRLEPPTLPANRIGVPCFLGARQGLGARDFEDAWRTARSRANDPGLLRYAQLRI